MKNIILFVVLAAVAPAVHAAADSAKAVAYTPAAPKAAGFAGDNASDAAFASDLRSAEEFLRRISREKKMDPAQFDKYKTKEIGRARQYYRWAAAEAVPHSRAMAQKMKAPDELMAEGRRLVAADPASWKGYDYLATGSLLKDDVAGAKENFEKALAVAPEFQQDWFRYMLAGCHNISKDTGQALELYDGVIDRNDNWVAVKSAYITASLILIGRDDDKAARYFDRGMSLRNPAERKALLGTGTCAKFKAGKLPEFCAAAGQ